MTTRPSLVEVLRVCRRVLRALDPDRTGSLGRIKGGFHLRAPGVSLEIRGDSVDIRRWDLSQKRLSATLEVIARLLDVNPTNAPLVAQVTLPDGQMKPSLSTTLVEDSGGFAIADLTADGKDTMVGPNDGEKDDISF